MHLPQESKSEQSIPWTRKIKSNYDNYCENDETLLVLRGDGSTDNSGDNDLKTAK